MFAQTRALIGRVGTVHRTVMIAVVLLLPMGFVTLGYVDIQRGQAAFSSRERDGVAYLRPALALLAGVVQARREAASGSITAGPGLPGLIAAVDDADARYGPEPHVTQQWTRARSALARARTVTPAQRPIDAYADASAALLRLIVTVSDTSNLTIDSDLDSYYLVDALAFRLPLMLELNAQVAAAVAGPRPGAASAADRTRLDLARIAGALNSTQAAIDSGMATAQAATRRADLRHLRVVVESERRSVRAMLTQIDRAVENRDLTMVSAALGDQTHAAVVTLVGLLLPELDGLLVTRIGALQDDARRVEIAALIAVLMIGLLMVRLHRAGADRRRALLRASLVRHAAVTANSADTFAAAASSVQRFVCTKLGWLAGHAWTATPEPAVWQIADHRHRHRDACALAALAEREGTPNDCPLAAEVGTRIVSGSRLTARLGVDVRGCRVGAMVTVPVLAGGEVAGMLAFYLPRGASRPHADLIPGLEQIGLALGRVVERQRTGAALVHQANHDPVTGLANRWRMLDAITTVQRECADRSRDGDHSAVLLINLDRFSLINDSLGYAGGDAVLQQVAERLRADVRPGDVVARLGADEFAVLVRWRADAGTTADDAAESAALAHRLLRQLREPVTVLGHQVPLRASVGIRALTGGSEDADPEAVLRDADAALRLAKMRGKDQVHTFDAALRSTAAARLDEETALAAAVAAGGLTLHYQPIIGLDGGRSVGAEALVRWPRPGHGLVPPDRFIALAEDSGLILDLGRWVLRQACQDAATWSETVPLLAEGTISVNVSTRQLIHPRFLTDLDEALRDSALPPSRLVVEITESALIGDPDAVMATLLAIRGRGVHLALDDFGTGYSSLSYVQHLPVTILKIDKSFVDPITGPGAGTTLSEVVLKLAEATGLRTIAEGVETPAQAEALRLLGCQAGQGYTWSRPVPQEELAGTVATIADLAGRTTLR